MSLEGSKGTLESIGVHQAERAVAESLAAIKQRVQQVYTPCALAAHCVRASE